MIIEFLLNSIILLFTTVLDFVNIPQLEQSLVQNVEQTLGNICNMARGLINLVIPYNIAVVLGGIVLVIESAFLIYALVMWVIRKIPVASIE